MEAGDNAYPPELAESIETLSRVVVANEGVSSTVGLISELAVQAIDGAEVCSVSFARKGEITTIASTADIGDKIDRIQYESGEGPCLSAIDRAGTFHIADMDRDETWPTFSKRVVDETGIKSMLSYVLEVDRGALGALNLTSTKVESFSKGDLATGTLFAAPAGIALANSLTHEADQVKIRQLEEGLVSRQMIGQAVGLIMSSHRVDPDEAFRILVHISQNANIKVRDLAQQMIDKATES